MQDPNDPDAGICTLKENDVLPKRDAEQSRIQLLSWPSNPIKHGDLNAFLKNLFYEPVGICRAVVGDVIPDLTEVADTLTRYFKLPTHEVALCLAA